MDKQRLIDLASELLKEENLESRNDDLQFLKRQYKYILARDEDSYYEQQLNDKFLALYSELAKKADKLNVSSYEEKKQIIASMRKLLERKDILIANKELNKLSNDFKAAGRCSKEQDDELWNEFKAIKDEFYDNKRKYFEELDKSNAEKRVKKENIIAKAKEVCKLENFKDANGKMDELRRQWKEVGYSGKEDEALWQAFKEVLDEFQDKRNEHRQEMKKVYEDRAAKKEELIKEAKKVLANSEFTEEEVNKVKSLRTEWKEIGFAGKEKDDDLYHQFDEVIKKYFEEKKFYVN